jgi:hypothetical protein
VNSLAYPEKTHVHAQFLLRQLPFGTCRPLLAQSGHPLALQVRLLSKGQRVVDFNAEIPHCALDTAMTKEQLDSSKIAGSAIDQRRFGPSKRVRTIERWVQTDATCPLLD